MGALFSRMAHERPRTVRSSLVVLLLIAWLRTIAVAAPGDPATPPHDPDARARAPRRSDQQPTEGAALGAAGREPVVDSPWIDLAPSKVLAMRTSEGTGRGQKIAAAATLAAFYVGFSGWTYFAWYRKGCRKEPLPCDGFIWGKDGSFGVQTYAAGADKLGHAWATQGLARLGTEMLYQWGGYGRRTSTIVGTALSEALFLGVEIRDGFSYQFSYWDFAFNTFGAALALAQSTWPRFDEFVDFRVQYFPSTGYRERFQNGDIDIAEDYSGQTYLLALHLGALRGLRDWRWGGWSRYVDVAIGFETRGYKPEPPKGEEYPLRQTLFFGLTLNAQGVFDRLLERRSRPRKVLHGIFEMFNLPYATLPVLDATRRPMGPVDMEGGPDGT
jgi:Predicted periplasmic lipoprotein (DUF2279)